MSDERFTKRNMHTPGDELDALLIRWHEQNREAAEAERADLMEKVRKKTASTPRDAVHESKDVVFNFNSFRRIVMHRYTRLAASIAILAMVVAVLFPPSSSQTAAAGEFIMLPDGGRLDAFDERGSAIGPCPLTHTDVDVQISGHFSRVTVNQVYENTYDRKIEAVYTFPLSHRGAVDRMTMTIGDRVIEGEVKERELARQMYEAARDVGYVAALLEQERPNIFTQSVANIEPGATIEITISYIEILESVDGEYQFAFPMVVAPRYVPGQPASESLMLPEGLEHRRGIILRGPARSIETQPVEGEIAPARLHAVLSNAVPINQPSRTWWNESRNHVEHQFAVRYQQSGCSSVPGGRTADRCPVGHDDRGVTRDELGVLYANGTGQIGGRWFFHDRDLLTKGGFSPDTDQVPDASKVTPMPVHPEKRAGHDISVTVTIDTGGPGLLEINSAQHEVSTHVLAENGEGEPRQVSLALKAEREIPNRDFLLAWKQTGEAVNEAIFTHTGDSEKYDDFAGGFFTMVLEPPHRVEEEDIRPREIIFVMDNSGSMRSAQLGGGYSALSAAKKVINQAIDTMRPNDRFNVISFNNTLDVLWDAPQPNTEENRARAQRYVDQRQGGGGTEMRNAVLKALERQERDPAAKWLTPRQVLDLPADGREIRVAFPMEDLRSAPNGIDRHYVTVSDELKLELRIGPTLLRGFLPKLATLRLTGEWRTVDGQRVLHVTHAEQVPMDDDDFEAVDPMRIVLFVTDGLVANDDAIIRTIRENADRTRVFTIGMSRSPNRYLLDEMARAGRGTADYVLPDDDVEPIVERFARRIATPVLTDISLEFSNELKVFDVLPGLDRLPDLFDVQPLVIHGRYDPTNAASGTLTIRGRTGAGAYERTIDLDLPAEQPDHDVIATLWARSMVDKRKREDDRGGIITLGESFQIMSEHTSFVAVEKARITVGGKPMLVRVPIEFPKDMSWEGIFGDDGMPPRELRTDDELASVMSQLREHHAQVWSDDRASTSRQDDVDAEEVSFESAPHSDMNRALHAPPPQRVARNSSDGRRERAAHSRRRAPDDAVMFQQAAPEPEAEPQILPPSSLSDLNAPNRRDPRGHGGVSGGGGGGTRFGTPGVDDALNAKIVELRRSLGDDEEAIKLFDRLAAKLDPRLIVMLYEPDEKVGDDDVKEAAPRRLMVAILPRDVDQATLDVLGAHGFITQSTLKPNTLIVGIITLDKLKTIALLDEVRYIRFVREIIDETKP